MIFATFPSFISLFLSHKYLYESPILALTLGHKDNYKQLFKILDDIGLYNDNNY